MGYVHGIKIRDLCELTQAERELINVYRNNPGKTFSEIGAIIGVKQRCVSGRVKIIREKLNVNSLAEAVEVVEVTT
jgi:DNA-binding CsgD family transcriptional regulator